jgi:hypothetical protein
MRVIPVLAAIALGAQAFKLQSHDAAAFNPVTRVVQLLNKLKEQRANEFKEAKDQYWRFHCWCVNTQKDKDKTIAAADTRIGEIDARIKQLNDINAEEHDLTDERKTLTERVAAAKKAIKEADEFRQAQELSFNNHKDEIAMAIKAIKAATKTLKDNAAKYTMFLQGSDVHPRSVGEALERVLMTERDMERPLYAELRLLMAEPKKDWKKLNQDAEHLKKYGSQAGGVIGLLEKLQAKYEAQEKERKDQETEDAKNYGDDDKERQQELTDATKALAAMAGEKAARQAEVDELTDEKKGLGANKKTDEQIKIDVKKDCDTKKANWDKYEKAHGDEMDAYGKAIGILKADDARDTFGRAWRSKATGEYYEKDFLQVSEVKSEKCTAAKAGKNVVKKVASFLSVSAGTTNPRALGLMAMLRLSMQKAQSAPAFDFKTQTKAVVDEIKKLITDLKDELKTDLKNKETCEKDLNDSSEVVREAAQAIDREGTKVTDERNTKREKEAEKVEAEEEKAKTEQDILDGQAARDKDNAFYLKEKKDNEDAEKLLKQAKAALAKVFMQVPKGKLRTELKAGEAAAPPPEIAQKWEKSSMSGNIHQMFDMVIKLFQEDAKEQDQAEKDAEAAWKSIKTEMEKKVKDLEDLIIVLKKAIAACVKAIGDSGTEIDKQQGLLDTDKEAFVTAAPDCKYWLNNWRERQDLNRQEQDGLKKALTFLGSFKKITLFQELC